MLVAQNVHNRSSLRIEVNIDLYRIRLRPGLQRKSLSIPDRRFLASGYVESMHKMSLDTRTSPWMFLTESDDSYGTISLLFCWSTSKLERFEKDSRSSNVKQLPIWPNAAHYANDPATLWSCTNLMAVDLPNFRTERFWQDSSVFSFWAGGELIFNTLNSHVSCFDLHPLAAFEAFILWTTFCLLLYYCSILFRHGRT